MVIFAEVDGMSQLNDKKPRRIRNVKVGVHVSAIIADFDPSSCAFLVWSTCIALLRLL